MVLIGGSGYFLGPIIGAAIVLLLQHWLSSYTEYWGLVLGPAVHRPDHGAREGIAGIGDAAMEPVGRQAVTEALRAAKVSKSFGRFQALKDVDLVVMQGERRAIIGPNGAGKSTLFNVIAGQFPPSSGAIYLAGRPTTGLRPDQIWSHGLTRTFQRNQLFQGLSVWDNVALACAAHRDGASRLRCRAASRERGESADILRRVHLLDHAPRDRAQPRLWGAAPARAGAGARRASRTSCCSTSRPPACRRPRRNPCSR